MAFKQIPLKTSTQIPSWNSEPEEVTSASIFSVTTGKLDEGIVVKAINFFIDNDILQSPLLPETIKQEIQQTRRFEVNVVSKMEKTEFGDVKILKGKSFVHFMSPILCNIFNGLNYDGTTFEKREVLCDTYVELLENKPVLSVPGESLDANGELKIYYTKEYYTENIENEYPEDSEDYVTCDPSEAMFACTLMHKPFGVGDVFISVEDENNRLISEYNKSLKEASAGNKVHVDEAISDGFFYPLNEEQTRDKIKSLVADSIGYTTETSDEGNIKTSFTFLKPFNKFAVGDVVDDVLDATTSKFPYQKFIFRYAKTTYDYMAKGVHDVIYNSTAGSKFPLWITDAVVRGVFRKYNTSTDKTYPKISINSTTITVSFSQVTKYDAAFCKIMKLNYKLVNPANPTEFYQLIVTKHNRYPSSESQATNNLLKAESTSTPKYGDKSSGYSGKHSGKYSGGSTGGKSYESKSYDKYNSHSEKRTK